MSVRVCVEPRLLEKLLEALSRLSFPINPEIYHQAGVGYVYADGREEVKPATMVEFPAFSGHLEEVREVILGSELPRDSVHVRGMFENIHSDQDSEAAPRGAAYLRVNFYRRLAAA
ncbi:MAG: hypothetical protein GY953_50270 [bacterium]|nr:hypothetical protein [bacterium]